MCLYLVCISSVCFFQKQFCPRAQFSGRALSLVMKKDRPLCEAIQKASELGMSLDLRDEAWVPSAPTAAATATAAATGKFGASAQFGGRFGNTGKVGAGKVGAEKGGAGKFGAGKFGAGKFGAGKFGAGKFGTGQVGAGQVGADKVGAGDANDGADRSGATSSFLKRFYNRKGTAVSLSWLVYMLLLVYILPGLFLLL